MFVLLEKYELRTQASWLLSCRQIWNCVVFIYPLYGSSKCLRTFNYLFVTICCAPKFQFDPKLKSRTKAQDFKKNSQSTLCEDIPSRPQVAFTSNYWHVAIIFEAKIGYFWRLYLDLISKSVGFWWINWLSWDFPITAKCRVLCK